MTGGSAFEDQLAQARVLPVITPLDVGSTVELVRALQRGGMCAVEITLRSDAALQSIAEVKRAVPDLSVAAGTINNPDEMSAAVSAGADFCVSPGLTTALLEYAAENAIRFLPGVATASEVMQGRAFGVELFKLFPAVPVGGMALLKSLAGPFPGVGFCPTGGLTPENFREFLALPNVVCCGGSWMVSDSLVRDGRWDDIEALARDAMTP
ncbi:MAG: bifunctional 4-hydroxy-2-oxoglutarate aldolase/2-dehydro-3-deoxy-phosphogluconate aldolase [Halioglobus sp.]